MRRPVLDSVFTFDPDDLGSAHIVCAEKSLTFRSLGGDKYGFGDSQEVSMFIRNEDGSVSVPRRYAFSEFPKDLLDAAEDKTSGGSDINIVFNEAKQAERPDLKKRQDDLINEYLAEIEATNSPMKGGILCAACGTGKTVISAKLFAKIGKTTLVVVHKEFLADQWRERLLSFTDLKDSDIGIAQQNKCEFEGKKVVIAMVQSLIESNRYPEAFYRWPGVVCYDETHRMAAPQFQRAVSQFPAKYRIGVTATPRRADGLQPVFEWHIGKVVAKMDGGNEVIPKIYQVKTDTYYPDSLYCWKNQDGKIKKLFLGKLVNLIVEDRRRNQWIGKEVVRALSADRKVMVLSDRLEHLRNLESIVKGLGSSSTIGYFIGGMDQEERSASARCDLILGTFQMAKEGLDIPDIDTLFLTTPKSDVEQSVGRILRYHEDKKDPIVVDMVDTMPTCIDFAAKRLRQYGRLRWTVCSKVV